MGELGISAEIADLCLNHTISGKVTRTYQRSPRFGEMSQAWLKWGEQLARWKTEAEANPVFQAKLAAKIKEDQAREARYAVVKARRETAAAGDSRQARSAGATRRRAHYLVRNEVRQARRRRTQLYPCHRLG